MAIDPETSISSGKTSVPRAGPEPRSRPARRRRRTWLFSLMTLGLIGVGQEFLFRALFPIPEIAGFNRINYQMTAAGHPALARMLGRGLVYDRLLTESRPDGWAQVHELNAFGFRGRDFTIARSPGKRRVLLIGDSVTEGMGTPGSATIDRVLEERMIRDGHRAEVINLGVIAATLSHTMLLLRDAVPLLRPDDVIVVLYANDLPAPKFELLHNNPGHGFSPPSTSPWMPRAAALVDRYIHDEPIYLRWVNRAIRFFPPVPDPANPWTEPSLTPGVLAPELHAAMRAGELNPWLKAQSEDIPRQLRLDGAGGGMPLQYFKRMAAICEEAGARLLIAYVPFCGVVSRDYAPGLIALGMDRKTVDAMATDPIYRRQNSGLDAACFLMRLPFADATEDLIRAEQSGVPQYWKYDTHPRPAGYATIARCIYEAMKRPPPGRR